MILIINIIITMVSIASLSNFGEQTMKVILFILFLASWRVMQVLMQLVLY